MAKRKFRLVEDYEEALRVLDEFVSDVEAAFDGDTKLQEEWPDLYVTYQKARKVVRDDG